MATKLQTISIVLPLIIAALSTFLLVKNFQRDNRLNRWPRVAARIVSSTIERTGSGYTGHDSRLRHAWQNDITYTYTLDGIEYTGSKVSNQPIWSSTQTPDSTLIHIRDKYPEGSMTEVYYDPTNPANSYLFITPTRGRFVLLCITVLCVLFTAWVLFSAPYGRS